jgi:hypothetical protein
MPFVTSGTDVIQAIFCRTWCKDPSHVFQRAPSARSTLSRSYVIFAENCRFSPL